MKRYSIAGTQLDKDVIQVGDGTTSVIVLTGEMLKAALPLLERNLHPTVIVRGYALALDAALEACSRIAKPISLEDKPAMLQLVQSCIGTKFSSRWGDLVISMALEATLRVTRDRGDVSSSDSAAGIDDIGAAPNAGSAGSTGKKTTKEVDIKRWVTLPGFENVRDSGTPRWRKYPVVSHGKAEFSKALCSTKT